MTQELFLDRKNLVNSATVVPIDKKSENKYTVSNFRPVNLINCFSKIYENYVKNHMVNFMSNYMSPYVSAYKKGYNSQHVLIRLLEEWRQHLDNNSRQCFYGLIKSLRLRTTRSVNGKTGSIVC